MHYNLLKTLNNGQVVIGRYPLNVQIQTISTCNGKCKFCPYQGSWHQKHPGKMDWPVYRKVIDNLRNYRIGKFCPYLENEPLLDTEIFEKIRYAIANLKPRSIELSTNLSVLSEDMLDEIGTIFPTIKHEIWVSFHGASKETYEEIMGLNFERSLNNVLKLVELSQKLDLKLVIRGAGSPITSHQNLKTWFGKKDYCAFWRKNLSDFKKKPKIWVFTYHDRAGSKPLQNRKMSFNTIFRENLKGFYCVRFDRWLHFLYTGEPILCCMDYERKTAFNASIQDHTVEELYGSSFFYELVKKGVGLTEAEENFICKRCASPGG